MSAAVSIKVSLVLGAWLRDVRHPVFIQLHTVQVACWSNWILRRISSAVHTVNRYCGCGRCVFTFHLSRLFATLIHVSLFFISLLSSLSVSSGLRKSFISSFHLFFWSSHWCVCLVLGAGSILLLSLPIVHLVAMQFSFPSAMPFFCVFQSSMGFWLLSSFHML